MFAFLVFAFLACQKKPLFVLSRARGRPEFDSSSMFRGNIEDGKHLMYVRLVHIGSARYETGFTSDNFINTYKYYSHT